MTYPAVPFQQKKKGQNKCDEVTHSDIGFVIIELEKNVLAS
jgi:hypothetical protein